jgi:hypothetical protein
MGPIEIGMPERPPFPKTSADLLGLAVIVDNPVFLEPNSSITQNAAITN